MRKEAFDEIWQGIGTRLTFGPDNQDNTLRIEPSEQGVDPIEIKKLSVLGDASGVGRTTATLIVADRRWLLKRKPVYRRYNIPRRAGTTRWTGSSNVVQNQPLAEDVQYRYHTTNNGSEWTAQEVLEDLLDALAPGEWEIRTPIPDVPIDHLTLEGDGDLQLHRLLAWIGGIDLAVSAEGILYVMSPFDGDEDDVVNRLIIDRGQLRGTGDVRFVDNRHIRPELVHVDMDREIEVRFDFDEDAGKRSVIRNISLADRTLENVMPVPDVSITMPDGRELARGTWVQIKDYLDAIASVSAAGGSNFAPGPLTIEVLRTYYNAMPGGLRTWLPNLYAKDPAGNEDPVWMDRINAIIKHWRHTFRVNSAWRDICESWRPYRVGVVDPETGGRAEALVMSDYMIRPSMRSLFADNFGGITRHGFIGGEWAQDFTDGDETPAEIRVIHQDQGIFSVHLELDPYGEAGAMAMGKVSKDSMPAESPADVIKLWIETVLDADFKLSIILTLIPGGPNGEGDVGQRFHRETYDAAQVVPGATAGGPPLAIRAPSSGYNTARFIWTDGESAFDDNFFQILDAFELGRSIDIKYAQNPEQILSITEAMAHRTFIEFADRWEGRATLPFSAEVEPKGSINRVAHMIDTTGRVTTRVFMDPQRQDVNPWAFVPDAIQRVALERVQVD